MSTKEAQCQAEACLLTWRYGCLKGPDWISDICTWTEEISGIDTRSLRQVGEGRMIAQALMNEQGCGTRSLQQLGEEECRF